MHPDALAQVQRSLERAFAPHLNDADQATAYASHIAQLYAEITCIQETLAKIVTHKSATAAEFTTLQATLCQSWPQLTTVLATIYETGVCPQAAADRAALATARNTAGAAHSTPALTPRSEGACVQTLSVAAAATPAA